MTQRKAAQRQAWRSRIVGARDVAPADLVPHPLNWRTHPKAQREALGGALAELGWVQRIIVNRTTGHIIDGHARYELALAHGEPAVPVLDVELTEDEERLVLATLDPLAAMAADDGKLAELLAGVSVTDAALAAMLDGMRPQVVLGAGDQVGSGERAGSSPWSRVAAGDPNDVRCMIGDIEFSLPRAAVIVWVEVLRGMPGSLREGAREWFLAHVTA